ncbi:MAG TPA: hypothetical protein VHY37_11015 [Tepidisphaeraceae bacterium]|jgi:hypothetical protein|nr:hypothetical protein [Tepidisphaeraceae bacterium]
MPEENEPKRRLSEISHLFLSSVRDRQTGGAPRPKRTPPPSPSAATPAPKGDISIDLTPEELAQVVGESRQSAELMPRPTPPVTAVLGAHLNGRQFDRVKEYARHLAARIGRVGLIETDAAETRIMYFVPSAGDEDAHSSQVSRSEAMMKTADPRALAEALEELNCDVDRWLLLVPDVRTVDGRALLRETDHWAVLSTADHDGVVSTYRMLKGLCDTIDRPRLTMALLDRPEEAQIGKVFRKLAGVCQQFLQWTLEIEEPIAMAPGVSEHGILCCRPVRDAQQSTVGPWHVVRDFLESIRTPAQPELVEESSDDSMAAEMEQTLAEFSMPELPQNPPAQNAPAPAAPAAAMQAPGLGAPAMTMPAPSAAPISQAISDVIDLAEGTPSAETILSAIVASSEHALVPCPIRPPMCPHARLAVNRDRTLVLLGVAHTGLKELTAIGQALHWLAENRALIAMAMPQLAIDAQRAPLLRLLVDKSDAAAATLRPLLERTNVELSAYRTIRWSGKMGLLLEAA